MGKKERTESNGKNEKDNNGDEEERLWRWKSRELGEMNWKGEMDMLRYLALAPSK